MHRTPVATLFLLLCACQSAPPACFSTPPPASPAASGNIVLIVLDDIGVDKIGAYGVHPRPAPTPRLDALAAQGMRFTSAYAEPTCSPSRAALLTGRRPIRTGIGRTVGATREDGFDLSESELLIPEALQEAASGPWATMAVGKWHLSLLNADGATAPLRHGFDRFDGILANPATAVEKVGQRLNYYRWEHNLDGQLSISDRYLVEAQTEAALAGLQTLPEPFFLYVAFSGAHGPLHVPPATLWSLADPVDAAGVGDAMIEALDHEVGRLLDAIGDRATILVLGDNGTSSHILREPSVKTRAKGTVYTGGTHVPLLVVGQGIDPGVSDALVHITDIFPTVLEMAGLDPTGLGLALDGVSLLPVLQGESGSRRCALVESFSHNGNPDRKYDVSLIEEDYSLVRRHGRPDELYARDPLSPIDAPNLAKGPLDDEARQAFRRMRRQLREEDSE